MFQVTLYTDGSCLGNPGPGGYAAILQSNGRAKEITGSANHTTNNRMELQAVIAGLRALKRRCRVIVVTDSQYVVTILNACTERSRSNGRAKANLDLVQQVRQLTRQHDITVQQVRGHSGHASAGSAQAMNERCDRLATAVARQRLPNTGSVNQCAA